MSIHHHPHVSPSLPPAGGGRARRAAGVARASFFQCRVSLASPSRAVPAPLVLRRRCARPVLTSGGSTCLFGRRGGGGGGGGKREPGDADSSLWKSFEKAVGDMKKERTIEGMLREQLQKQELEGGGGGSGDIRSGRGDGSGGSGDEGSEPVMDEIIQVILATAGLILLYMYLIQGDELSALFKDYVKLLFGGKASKRLKYSLNSFQRFFQNLAKKKVDGKDELENTLQYLLFTTPTWWHHPRKSLVRVKTVKG